MVWHPNCHQLDSVVEQIFDHFGTYRFQNVTGGAGIEVVYRGNPSHDLPVPIQINWDMECPVVVITTIDNNFIEDDLWVQYLRDLQNQIEKHGKGSRLLPIAFESGVLDNLNLDQQAIRWDKWDPAREKHTQRLIRELAYNFRAHCATIFISSIQTMAK